MTTWPEEVELLLDEARAQIADLVSLHDQALAEAAVRGRFKVRVKSVLENQRSALDYLAVGITTQFGTPKKGKIYYPLAKSDQVFPSIMNSTMPGVMQAAPEIADVIRACQPHTTRGEWLGRLNRLTREQKHNRLTAQLVQESYAGRITELATGAFIDWDGIRFDRDGLHSDGGGFGIWPEPNRPPSAPKLLELDVGPTGYKVFGVPLDPATQQPVPNDRLATETARIERWNFVNPHQPVLWSLREFDGNIRRLVKEVVSLAEP
jgi:hypothetical protein